MKLLFTFLVNTLLHTHTPTEDRLLSIERRELLVEELVKDHPENLLSEPISRIVSPREYASLTRGGRTESGLDPTLGGPRLNASHS